jgi:hypothetical protein
VLPLELVELGVEVTVGLMVEDDEEVEDTEDDVSEVSEVDERRELELEDRPVTDADRGD